MRKLLVLSFLVCFIWITTASAQKKTLLYQGTWHTVPCSVTINWTNYSGLGPVSGEIFISGDKTYYFSGSNSAPGQLDIQVPGDPRYRFIRKSSGGTTVWALNPGGGVTFSRKTSGSGLPGSGGSGLPGGGSGIPGGAKSDPETTLSKGTWGGSPVSVTINWDNYKGQGPVNGNIEYNGASYSFSGSNSRKGYMAIKIDGVNGTYQLNKAGKGRSSIWSGSLNGSILSFSQSSSIISGGNNAGNQSGVTWLIACEAAPNKLSAERTAGAWRIRGFPNACVVHKSEYKSLDGDQDWWITCAGRGSLTAMKKLLPQVKKYFPTAYGIKASQSSKRETFH